MRVVRASGALLWLVAAPLLAQAPNPAPTPTEPSAALSADVAMPPPDEAPVSLAERLARIWRSGESEDDRIAEVRKLRDEKGLQSVPSVARALIVEGYRSLDAGDRERASQRFVTALELDPQAADARLGLAAVEGGGRFGAASLADAVKAVRGRLLNPSSSAFHASRLLVVLALGLCGAGLLAIAALVIRKQRLLRHDLEEALKRRFDPEVNRVLAWLVVLLPLLLTFDLYWAAVYWALLIWAYLEIRQEVVMALSLLFCAALLPGLGLAARLLQNSADPYATATMEYLDGTVTPAGLAALEAQILEHPDDAKAQLLAGLIYEREGQPRKAISIYRQLADQTKDASAYNNLADVYYRLDEKDKAFESWKHALEADAGFALAHYNLSLYYFGFFEFKEKDDHFNKAKEFDPRGLDRWVASGGGVIDATPDASEWRRWLWSADREGLARPVEDGVRAPQSLAALGAMVVGFVYARKRRSSGVAHACVRCGTAFCEQCRPGQERPDYCLQCIHLFIRKDGVSPQMRADKMREIGSDQTGSKVIAGLLSLFAPGAGGVYREQPIFGLALLIPWCVAWAAFVLQGRPVVEPGALARAAAVLPVWLVLIPAALVWVIGNASNAMRKG